MKVLVTGGNSGLGKYICNTIPNSINLTRNNRSLIKSDLKNKGVDLIIHCAFGFQGGYAQNEVEDYFKYVDDNILLTKELTEIPHKKIVYISSTAVYDPDPINYKFVKKYSEAITSTLGNNPLILRCPSMLGKFMKPNNLTRLLDDPNTQLSLSKDSDFNYVLHSDILSFILECYDKSISENINFVSSTNLTFKQIQELLKIDIKFGKYTFNTPWLSNEKLVYYSPSYNKTSQEVFKQFLEQYKS